MKQTGDCYVRRKTNKHLRVSSHNDALGNSRRTKLMALFTKSYGASTTNIYDVLHKYLWRTSHLFMMFYENVDQRWQILRILPFWRRASPDILLSWWQIKPTQWHCGTCHLKWHVPQCRTSHLNYTPLRYSFGAPRLSTPGWCTLTTDFLCQSLCTTCPVSSLELVTVFFFKFSLHKLQLGFSWITSMPASNAHFNVQ